MRTETKLFEDTLEEDIDEEESFNEKFKSFESSTIKKKGISLNKGIKSEVLK